MALYFDNILVKHMIADIHGISTLLDYINDFYPVFMEIRIMGNPYFYGNPNSYDKDFMIKKLREIEEILDYHFTKNQLEIPKFSTVNLELEKYDFDNRKIEDVLNDAIDYIIFNQKIYSDSKAHDLEEFILEGNNIDLSKIVASFNNYGFLHKKVLEILLNKGFY